MTRRQTIIPRRWLITDQRLEPHLLALIARLPSGTGVLVRHHQLRPGERQRLLRRIRRIGRSRGLLVVDEAEGPVARVHGVREIGRARLAGAELLLVSPLFETRSHPGWPRLPRMRAAALIRLARAPAIALGGMSERRFGKIEGLGFAGWAAVDAWLKLAKVPHR